MSDAPLTAPTAIDPGARSARSHARSDDAWAETPRYARAHPWFHAPPRAALIAAARVAAAITGAGGLELIREIEGDNNR